MSEASRRKAEAAKSYIENLYKAKSQKHQERRERWPPCPHVPTHCPRSGLHPRGMIQEAVASHRDAALLLQELNLLNGTVLMRRCKVPSLPQH